MIDCYVLSVPFAGLTLMWFIKLLNPSQQATVQSCTYLPRPPPLPDPSPALFRLVMYLSLCPTVSAAPLHFWKVCYVSWVGGISSGSLLFFFAGILLWLLPYLRLSCWVFSPVLSSFSVSAAEVLQHSFIAMPMVQSIFFGQIRTLQSIAPRLVVDWSSS